MSKDTIRINNCNSFRARRNKQRATIALNLPANSQDTVPMNNRSVPTSTILAHICYRDLAAACAWLTRVFGFTEYYRYGQPLSGIQLYLGDAHIMISGPREGRFEPPGKLGLCTQMLTIIVPDVEAHYANTKRHRATIWEELQETVYGEKQYGVTDLEGHRWLFSQHACDVDPESWGATVVSRPT
jgi:uncharacterized glyoxalase superfamily protein PhnB